MASVVFSKIAPVVSAAACAGIGFALVRQGSAFIAQKSVPPPRHCHA